MDSPTGEFANHQGGLTGPIRRGVAVSPHDTTALAETPRALWVGGAGNLSLIGLDGATFTLVGVPAGSLIPVMPTHVRATSTTATSIVALY